MSTVASKPRGIWSKKVGGSYWSTAWLSRTEQGGWLLGSQEWRQVTTVGLTREDVIRLRDALNRELEENTTGTGPTERTKAWHPIGRSAAGSPNVTKKPRPTTSGDPSSKQTGG